MKSEDDPITLPRSIPRFNLTKARVAGDTWYHINPVVGMVYSYAKFRAFQHQIVIKASSESEARNKLIEELNNWTSIIDPAYAQ